MRIIPWVFVKSIASYFIWQILKKKILGNLGEKHLDRNLTKVNELQGFPGGSVIKNSPANAGGMGLIPGSGRPPGEGNGNQLQYSCLGNHMDREPRGHKESDTTEQLNNSANCKSKANRVSMYLMCVSTHRERGGILRKEKRKHLEQSMSRCKYLTLLLPTTVPYEYVSYSIVKVAQSCMTL